MNIILQLDEEQGRRGVHLHSCGKVVPTPPPQQTDDLLNQLLQLLLPPSVTRALETNTQPQPIIKPTEVTSLVTHSSTYITTLTQSSTSLLEITFRNKPIVTTLVDTTVTKITATEFSTETQVSTSNITEYPTPPQRTTQHNS